jgi:hypothetical protein
MEYQCHIYTREGEVLTIVLEFIFGFLRRTVQLAQTGSFRFSIGILVRRFVHVVWRSRRFPTGSPVRIIDKLLA